MSEEEEKAIEDLKKLKKGIEILNLIEEEKEAIKIVKEFNKENKFRDCGRLNNAIDIVIRMAEEKNKYNITTLPFEKIKVDIEQNKNIFIFGKEYINKDKIREKIKELKNRKWSYTKLEDIRRVDDEIGVLGGLLCDGCEFGAEDYDNCIGCENDE